jgi:hypothetical protein
MRAKIVVLTLLVGIVAGTAVAQQASKPVVPGHGLNIALTYVPERAQFSSTGAGSSSFWFQGGGLQLGRPLQHGWNGVLDFTGAHAASVASGHTGLDLITLTAGPRYGRRLPNTKYSLFGQALAGGAFGFNGIFPDSNSVTSTSSKSVAVKLGGGLDADVAPRLKWRVIEANWLYTRLTNAGNNQQHTLQFGTGLVYHF